MYSMFNPQQRHQNEDADFADTGSTVTASSAMPGYPMNVVQAFPCRRAKQIGATLIFAGCLSAACNVVAISVSVYFQGFSETPADASFVGHGLWCGAAVSESICVKFHVDDRLISYRRD
jgi:hypothetical protein